MNRDPIAEFHRYRQAFGSYEAFALRAASLLEAQLHSTRTKFEQVTSRPKEPISAFRKLVSKLTENSDRYVEHGFDALEDRVGIRVVVSTSAGAERVIEQVREVFEVAEEGVERKALTNPPDQLRYLGVHVMSRLRLSDQAGLWDEIASMTFEVQIHTLAETAWAVISHPVVYKPYGRPPPRDLAGKVFRGVALVSLFDSEVAAALTLQESLPDYAAVRMLRKLDTLFDPWRRRATGRRPISDGP